MEHAARKVWGIQAETERSKVSACMNKTKVVISAEWQKVMQKAARWHW